MQKKLVVNDDESDIKEAFKVLENKFIKNYTIFIFYFYIFRFLIKMKVDISHVQN
jgi:hypothetical protein